MQALKAANPAVKVLQYRNLSAISSLGSGPQYSSGVGYPDWMVLRSDMVGGMSAVRGAGYFGVDWKLDPGESAWQH